jgi:hypothetical protein
MGSRLASHKSSSPSQRESRANRNCHPRNSTAPQNAARKIIEKPLGCERNRVTFAQQRQPTGSQTPGNLPAPVGNENQQCAARPEKPCKQIDPFLEPWEMFHHMIGIYQVEDLIWLTLKIFETLMDS